MVLFCDREKNKAMYMILISIVPAVFTFIYISRRMCIKKIKESLDMEMNDPAGKSFHRSAIQRCGVIIDKALECVSCGDDIAVCRNHRLGAEILGVMRKRIGEYPGRGDGEDNFPAIYHGYMLEATEKIAEISRNIVTSPDFLIPLSCRCEIEMVRDSLAMVMQSIDKCLDSEGNFNAIVYEIEKERDYIKHAIEQQAEGMSYKEFDEDGVEYSYLLLLYYLHSFMSSFSQVVRSFCNS